MAKIIYVAWFSGVHCVGIVVIENEIGEKKAYIGVISGFDEGLDAKEIAESGVTVTKESLREILSKLE